VKEKERAAVAAADAAAQCARKEKRLLHVAVCAETQWRQKGSGRALQRLRRTKREIAG
jgi:ribosomal protein L4